MEDPINELRRIAGISQPINENGDADLSLDEVDAKKIIEDFKTDIANVASSMGKSNESFLKALADVVEAAAGSAKYFGKSIKAASLQKRKDPHTDLEDLERYFESHHGKLDDSEIRNHLRWIQKYEAKID